MTVRPIKAAGGDAVLHLYAEGVATGEALDCYRNLVDDVVTA